MSFLSRGLVSGFDFYYKICRFTTETPKLSPSSCCLLYITYCKTPSKITFKNFGNFQGKYLLWSSVLVKLLLFTVILILIMKLMILWNFIMIPWNIRLWFWSRRNLNCIHLNHCCKKRENVFLLWLYFYFLLNFHSIYCIMIIISMNT